MVGVVVHHRHAAVLARAARTGGPHPRNAASASTAASRSPPSASTAASAATAFRRLWMPGTCEPEPERRGHRARRPRASVPSAPLRRRRRCGASAVVAEAEPHAPRGHSRAADALGAGIVRAHQRRLARGRRIDEGLLQRVHRAVALEVVGLDVVDDRDRRMRASRNAWSYSSASTTNSSSPPIRALPPQAATRPPASPVGCEPGRGQRLGRHDRGGGLAVGARDQRPTGPTRRVRPERIFRGTIGRSQLARARAAPGDPPARRPSRRPRGAPRGAPDHGPHGP